MFQRNCKATTREDLRYRPRGRPEKPPADLFEMRPQARSLSSRRPLPLAKALLDIDGAQISETRTLSNAARGLKLAVRFKFCFSKPTGYVWCTDTLREAHIIGESREQLPTVP